ncbi:MAG: sigma-54-dependent transcriptional regulator [Candidatus Nitrospinota bacterium M3_3B_026]
MNEKEEKKKILVLDDERTLRIVLSRDLARRDFHVDTAETVAEAEELLNEGGYSLAFVDIVLPDGSGLDLLEKIRKRPAAPSVVMMTAEATMGNAIKAMQKGAFDYLTKPFDLDEVEILVDRVMEYRRMARELAELKSAEPAAPGDEIVGRSPAMQEVFKLIGRAAGADATVLITGPTGAGKELVARALSANSPRAGGPFVTVNCAAIPKDLLESELFGHVKGAFTGAVEDKTGKFQAASGGVILLDEIGDMPADLQAKMLRVLQDGELYSVGGTRPVRVDVRVLAATNRDLASDVAAGRFREDLYHRLNVIHISLPPLRKRTEDIPLLTEHILSKIARAFNEKPKTVTPQAMELLAVHDWPGNVRELENVLRRAVIMSPGGAITLDSLPPELGGVAGGPDRGGDLKRAVQRAAAAAGEGKVYYEVVGRVEKALIEDALRKTGGARVPAARLLGMNRNTLTKKIRELGVEGWEAVPGQGGDGEDGALRR